MKTAARLLLHHGRLLRKTISLAWRSLSQTKVVEIYLCRESCDVALADGLNSLTSSHPKNPGKLPMRFAGSSHAEVALTKTSGLYSHAAGSSGGSGSKKADLSSNSPLNISWHPAGKDC
jgi:hypothetical protein